MKTTTFRAFPAILGIAALFVLRLASAQIPQPDPADESAQSQGEEVAELSTSTLEERLSAIEQDSTLQDATKEVLISKYRAALQSLEQADVNRSRTVEYREASQSAPRESAELTRQLEELPSPEEAANIEAPAEPDQLGTEVELRRTSLLDLDSQLESVDGELSQVTQRPAAIAVRLPKAQDELSAAENALGLLGEAVADTPSRAAERARLQALQIGLTAEVAMLRSEQSSQSARETRLAAQRNLLLKRRENERAVLTALEDQLQQQRLTASERLRQQVTQLATQFPEASGDAAQLIANLEILALELQKLTQMLENLDAEFDEVSTSFDLASGKYRRIREQVKLGGLAGTFGQTLIAQYRTMGNPRELELSIKARQQTLREVRLAEFEIEARLAEQAQWEQRIGADGPEAEKQLLATRKDALGMLQTNYREVIDDLLRIDSKSRDLQELILEFRGFLNEKLFWIRSAPAAGLEVLRDLPGSVAWLFSAKHGSQFESSLTGIPRRHPFLCPLAVVILAALLATRRRVAACLTARGKQVRRISTDRYSHTLAALAGTLLLTAPVPLALGFLGWALVRDPGAGGWLQGLGLGMLWATMFLGFVSFLSSCGRSGGLAHPHFEWGETTAKRLCSNSLKLFVPYVALLLVTSSTLFASDPQQLRSLGRVCFIVAQMWLTAGLWRLLQPSDGLLAQKLSDHPQGVLSRSRILWLGLVVGAPMTTAVLALVGYVLTAFALNAVFLGSLVLIAAGIVLYSLVLRWFTIKERKMAFAEALEKRRARREAASSAKEESEEPIPVEEVENDLNLEDISTQTRRLLRSLATVAVIVLLWWYWEKSLPIAEFLGTQPVGVGISFLSLAQASLIIVVATTVIRNLPGLLDLAGFRNSGIDTGTRYAAATIIQYALAAVALGLLANILELDWSQFGWIAAALSVGLGFGLQEVVANFVCGIILLFERPIRRGDVVTLDGVTGTVSRIRMRATTITNWDRQDYIVPNKQLITGSLINWTLTNTINRIVIPIGVAYGSDTGQAMKLLRETAESHPLIMDDPAPLISFESFGESTLDLILRCYLPNMDSRIKTITELHGEIDRRFREAGIEIAFPQHDLHLRSMDPGIPSPYQNQSPSLVP